MINMELAKKRNLSQEEIKEIEMLHELREGIFDGMEKAEEKYLPYFDEELDLIESRLQKLWGYEQNHNYVKFWNRPRCECPKIDNEENYPHGYYIINGGCPLHGGKN